MKRRTAINRMRRTAESSRADEGTSEGANKLNLMCRNLVGWKEKLYQNAPLTVDLVIFERDVMLIVPVGDLQKA